MSGLSDQPAPAFREAGPTGSSHSERVRAHHAMPPQRRASAPTTSSADAASSASTSAANLLHPKPRGTAPKCKDGHTLCTWDGNRGCWVDVDGSDHVPLSEADRKKQSRKRVADAAASAPDAVSRVPRPSGPAPASHPHWDDVAGVWRDDDGDPRPQATRNERRVEQKQQQDEEYTTWHNRQRAPFHGRDPWMHAPPSQMPCPQGALTREGTLRFNVGDAVWCCCGHYIHPFALGASQAHADAGRLDRFGQWLPRSYNDNFSFAFPLGTGTWPASKSVDPDERSAWQRGRIIKQWHQQESFGLGKYAAYAIVLTHPSSGYCEGWSDVRPQVFAPVDDDRCVCAYSDSPPPPVPVSGLISCSPRGWAGWDEDKRSEFSPNRFRLPPGVDPKAWMGLLLSPDEQPPTAVAASINVTDAPGEFTGRQIHDYCCSGSDTLCHGVCALGFDTSATVTVGDLLTIHDPGWPKGRGPFADSYPGCYKLIFPRDAPRKCGLTPSTKGIGDKGYLCFHGQPVLTVAKVRELLSRE